MSCKAEAAFYDKTVRTEISNSAVVHITSGHIPKECDVFCLKIHCNDDNNKKITRFPAFNSEDQHSNTNLSPFALYPRHT